MPRKRRSSYGKWLMTSPLWHAPRPDPGSIRRMAERIEELEHENAKLKEGWAAYRRAINYDWRDAVTPKRQKKPRTRSHK